jgi:lipoic acid synthetase
VEAIFFKTLKIFDWGVLPYGQALKRQMAWVEERIAGSSPDRLVLVEHPPVVTLGRSGGLKDLRISKETLKQKGIDLYTVDRGGMATFHGPGQLVAYPIIKLQTKDLHQYLYTLLHTVATVLQSYGLEPVFHEGRPGIWVGARKIASIGIAVRRWVTYHGIALNVNADLQVFNLIVPCGHPGETITSMALELGKFIDVEEVKHHFIKEFCKSFKYTDASAENTARPRHLAWLRSPAPCETTIHQAGKLSVNCIEP